MSRPYKDYIKHFVYVQLNRPTGNAETNHLPGPMKRRLAMQGSYLTKSEVFVSHGILSIKMLGYDISGITLLPVLCSANFYTPRVTPKYSASCLVVWPH